MIDLADEPAITKINPQRFYVPAKIQYISAIMDRLLQNPVYIDKDE